LVSGSIHSIHTVSASDKGGGTRRDTAEAIDELILALKNLVGAVDGRALHITPPTRLREPKMLRLATPFGKCGLIREARESKRDFNGRLSTQALAQAKIDKINRN
jgi:hypothetical protein